MVGMPPYADPTRCPDCGAPLAAAPESCARCGLPLRGETAALLFATLVRADELLAVLRQSPVPASAPGVGAPLRTGHAEGALAARPRRRARLTTASVPQILLGLGVACLLVAALVFLAVTWSALGVGGRTATLAGLTVLAGVLAAGLARRGLRAATEALSLVGLGLLTLDLLGAESAGWLGEVSTPGLLQLVGGVLVATGAATALAARRTPVGALTGAEAVAVLGTALLAVGVAEAEGPEALLRLLATVLAVLVAVAAHRVRLGVVLGGARVVAVASWLALTAYALDRTLGHDLGWRELWLDRQVWPLLAAAALAAAPALASRLSVLQRTGTLAVGHLLVTVALLAPAFGLHPTALTLVAVAVLLGTALLAWLLPRPWAATPCLTWAAAAAAAVGVSALLLVDSTVRLADAALPAWSGRAGDLLPTRATGAVDGPAAWLLPLCVLVLLGTAVAVGRALIPDPVGDPGREDAGSTRSALPGAGAGLSGAVLAASGVAASGVAAMALYPVPLWLVVGALVAGAVGAWRAAMGGRAAVPGGPGTGSAVARTSLAVTAAFLTMAVLVSLHAELLTAVVLCVVLVVATSVHLSAGTEEVSGVAGLVGTATLAGAAWAWGAVADVEPGWVSVSGLAALGAAVLLAPYLPDRWAGVAHRPHARSGFQAGAACSAAVLAAAGTLQSAAGEQSVWAAVHLTVAGAVVTATAVLQADRRVLAWPGGALLAAATWVRLEDLGVSAPEPYTLPTAVTLLAVGLHRLRRDPSSTSLFTLTPGLTLALVPTLLWVLDEPAGVRSLLLGVGCLLLVMSGARTGWTAPLALGAGVGALLLVRLGVPYVGDAVPRWVLIGAAGVLLLAMGTTWERRVADARAVLGYVRALR